MDHWKKQLQFILHKIPFRPLIIILVLAVCLGFGISNMKIEPKSQGEKNQNQVEILKGQNDTTGKDKNTDKNSKGITSGKDNNKNKENKDNKDNKESSNSANSLTESSNSTNSVAESSNSTKSLTESSASKGSSKSASISVPSASSPTPSAASAASLGSDSSVSPQAPGSAKQSGSSAETNDSSPQVPASYQVSLEIQCRSVSGDNSPVTDPTALERIHALNQGEILNANVTLSSGESVYTALVKATQAANIEMGARDTQYGVYIYEINYLREKMAGPGSGWMYSVNGKIPNKGCGAYYPSAGDRIVFFYVT
ncbi:DUF4430 domain-containing protein [Lachnospiraceae bacterium YH-ros2228]